MKYYSESLKKVFDTPEACEQAEQEYEAKIAAAQREREEKLDELKLLKEKYEEAKANAQKALEESNSAAKFSRDCYKELSNGVRAYFNRYGSVPKEYSNLNFMVEFLNPDEFFKPMKF